MTKRDVEKMFREQVLPEIKQEEAKFPYAGLDNCMRRTAWNDYVDSLQCAGYVTEKQAFNWSNPYDK